MTTMHRVNPDLSLPVLIFGTCSAVASVASFAGRATGSAVAAVGKALDIATAVAGWLGAGGAVRLGDVAAEVTPSIF